MRRPVVFTAPENDTVVIMAPEYCEAISTHNWLTTNLSFTADTILGKRYVVEIGPGSYTGIRVFAEDSTQEWIGQSSPGSSASMDIGTVGSHALRVDMKGAQGTYAYVRVVRVGNPRFVIFPQKLYVNPDSNVVRDTFSIPAAGESLYSLRAMNGSPDGTNRVSTNGGYMSLNRTQIFKGSDFSTSVPVMERDVSLVLHDTLAVEELTTGKHLKARVTAVDRTAPVVTLTSPPSADTVFTRNSGYRFSGSVTDETTGWLFLSDTTPWLTLTDRPWIATPGTFSDSVTLTSPQARHQFRIQATNSAKLTTTLYRWVVRDTVAPTFTVTSPGSGMTQTTDSLWAITGSWRDTTKAFITVDGDTVASGYGGSFSLPASSYPLDFGTNRIVLRATDQLGNVTEYTRLVYRKPSGESGTDSALYSRAIANAPSGTSTARFYDQVRFLFTGTSPPQAGVSDTTIFDTTRVAVVHGRVLARDFGPLPNVAARILNHPEYGSATTRADGRFDLVVNGGGPLVVRLSKAGYLESERQVQVPVNDYSFLPDVALVGRSSKRNTVSFAADTVVNGRFATDLNGDRKIKLRFQAGTSATMASGGASFNLIHLRLTEYTVAAGGPMSMPAQLPPGSAYTYCIDFSVDEADSIGQLTPQYPAPDVNFSKPVTCYLKNFLHYPVGTAVPYGYYDRRAAKWIPQADGWVIRVLTNDGSTVTIDSKGNGVADGTSRKDSLGITSAELQALAHQYAAGDTIWRQMAMRFSNADFNCNPNLLPSGVPGVATIPNPLPDLCPQPATGSIINCEDRILGERIPIMGTPFSINYRSFRASGDSLVRSVIVPLLRDSVPTGLVRVVVQLDVAGQHYEKSVDNPTLSTSPVVLTWNGQDAYGRPVHGRVSARVSVGYCFRTTAAAGSGGQSLGNSGVSGAGIGQATGNRQIDWIRWNRQLTSLGVPGTESDGLGGWTLSPHHFYDSHDGTVYLGDGRVLRGDLVPGTIRQYSCFSGCSGSPTSINQLAAHVTALAYGPSGELYVATNDNTLSHFAYVYRVEPNGNLTPIVGSGSEGTFVDNRKGTETQLPHPVTSLAIAPDGSLYLASSSSSDPAGTIVAVVTPDDSIHKVIGGKTGQTYGGGDGHLAASDSAWVGYVGSLAVGPDGGLFLLDNYWANYHVRRIGPNNIITNYAGAGGDPFTEPDSIGVATRIRLYLPKQILADADGNVYIVNYHRVNVVAPDGTMRILYTTSGTTIYTTAMRSDGALYLATPKGVYRRETEGSLKLLGSSGALAPTTIPLDFMSAGDLWPIAVTLAPDGDFAMGNELGIWRVEDPYASPGSGIVTVPSRDGGEVYVFARAGSNAGRHLYTRDAFTGAVRYSFGYDGAGCLVTIRDVNGLTTTIQRNGSGPIAIVGPFGQRTRLGLDNQTSSPGGPFLNSVQDTLGNQWAFSTGSDGLLATFADPVGNQSSLHYGSDGRLSEDDGPASTGTSQALTVAYSGFTRTTTRTTAEQRVTTYDVSMLPDGSRQRHTASSGMRSADTDSSDLRIVSVMEDGSTSADNLQADDRFGFAAPLVRESRFVLPDGTTQVLDRKRAMTTSFNPPSVKGEWAENDSLNGATASRWQFNADSLIVRWRSPAGRIVTVNVDTAGRPLTVTVPGLEPRNYVYYSTGPAGSLKEVTEGGRGVRFKYDARGRLTAVRDTLQRETTLGYDLADRLTSTTPPGNLQSTLTVDAAGKAISLTPAGKPAHKFDYTAELLYRYRPPGAGLSDSLTEYAYNHDEQLTRIYRPGGSIVALGYGNSGRLDSITIQRGKIVAGYNTGSGLLTSLTSPDSVTLTIGYNGPADTITTWSGKVSGSVSYALNQDLRTSSQRVNGGNMVAYSYDADGLVTQAGDLSITRRSDNGLVSGTTLGSVTTSDSYSNHGDLWRRTAKYGGATLYDATYDRDSLGRVTALTEIIYATTTTYAYAYSDSGFLKSVTKNGTVTERYAYDANGNRVASSPPGDTTTATCDAQDRLTRYGNTAYTYTAAGELLTATTGSNVTRYTYDPLGNLLKVKLASGDSVEYLIDGWNRRAARKFNGSITHRWLYRDQLAPVAELDGSGNLISRFVYGTSDQVPDYFVKGGATYRIISDQLGSVRLVVNTSTGAVVQRLDYGGFGKVVTDSIPGFQPFGYAGGLWDGAIGLVRFGARDLDASVGRWTTKDPSGFMVGTINLYSYVAGDPVNYIDPSGLSRWYPVPGHRRWEVTRHQPHVPGDYVHDHYRDRGRDVPRKVNPETKEQEPHGRGKCTGPDEDVPDDVIEDADKAFRFTGDRQLDLDVLEGLEGLNGVLNELLTRIPISLWPIPLRSPIGGPVIQPAVP
jgi:RHS repeat-associated protein